MPLPARHLTLVSSTSAPTVADAAHLPTESVEQPAPAYRSEGDRAADPSSPVVGAILDDRYVLEAVLGQGGMGIVYRARHRILGRALAIKVLKPEVSRDAAVMERFRREAQAASAIGSPHICDVSDFGTLKDGSTYFVMERLEGPSLASAIGGRPMPEPRILHIARQLADALGAAHARGIVHRDLKPDNVHLVTRGGDADFVKVLDFGIAKVAGTQESKLTHAGAIFGTPHYMSPEQSSGREVDLRTDVYALGVMLYEMACGRVPFDADNLMGVLTKHVFERPIAPRELGLGVSVSPGLEAVILRCLEKSADARYASMAALRADLEALAEEQAPEALLDAMERMASVPPPPRWDTLRRVPMPGAPAAAPLAARSHRGALLGLALVLTLGLASAGLAGALAFETSTHPSGTGASSGKNVVVKARVVPAADRVDEGPSLPEDAAIEARVELATEPSRAEVYGPDGALLGNTPLALALPADGTVTYRIRAPGYQARDFVVSRATRSALTLQLEREVTVGLRPRPNPRIPDVQPLPLPPRVDPPPPRFEVPPVETDLMDPFRDRAPPPRR